MAPKLIVQGFACGVFAIDTEQGFVDQTHFGIFEAHRRGKNWIAVVRPNSAVQGGLQRDFLTRVKGSLYQIGETAPGAFLEVGADYLTSNGVRYKERRYFRLLKCEAMSWLVREAGNPLAHPRSLSLTAELELLEKLVQEISASA